MGLFDQIGGALRSALGDAESQAMPGLLGQLLGQTNLGSMGGLLQQLQQGGLGEQVSSWLSSGHNLPISADQLRSALGSEQVQQMAQQAGIPVDKLLAMLSQHLPQAVDQASPNGALEDASQDSQDDTAQQDDTQPGGSLADQAGLGDVGRR
jgi:uncharacterized protein YidB (DUF937 family)